MSDPRVNTIFKNEDVFLRGDLHGKAMGAHIALGPADKVDTRWKHTNALAIREDTPHTCHRACTASVAKALAKSRDADFYPTARTAVGQ